MAHQSEPAVAGVDIESMEGYFTGTDVEFAVLFGSHARGTADDSSDVDVAVRFPEHLNERDRFHLRNRIDADLQEYAESFVDVSDIESLPTPVAYAALRDGILLVGNEGIFNTYKNSVESRYKATADERERDRQEFIDRLARGDT